MSNKGEKEKERILGYHVEVFGVRIEVEHPDRRGTYIPFADPKTAKKFAEVLLSAAESAEQTRKRMIAEAVRERKKK